MSRWRVIAGNFEIATGIFIALVTIKYLDKDGVFILRWYELISTVKCP